MRNIAETAKYGRSPRHQHRRW